MSSATVPGAPTPLVKCANCGEREGTIRWGDSLALTHGFAVMWCEVCALVAQLAYAEERALLVPQLRRELKDALTRSEGSPSRSDTQEVQP